MNTHGENNFSKEQENKIEKALRNAKASMELDGFTITDEHTELVRSRLQGKISEEEFLREALERATGKKQ